jgi:hypothetical protein
MISYFAIDAHKTHDVTSFVFSLDYFNLDFRVGFWKKLFCRYTKLVEDVFLKSFKKLFFSLYEQKKKEVLNNNSRLICNAALDLEDNCSMDHE